ncbi:aldo/keto reductase [Pontibacter pamirensis]|uniref:aldo/keto reductase n=1 Tax=Pontibacter pamirensis TaxID=2562824 RepID=UPI001F47997B|nr:aldo/keto reductase [Pontibacter pamirensis]
MMQAIHSLRKLLKVRYNVCNWTCGLYLIHQPYGNVHGSWKAMQELYWEKKAQAVGVINFHPDRVLDLMVHHEVVPAVDQIETHPFQRQTKAQKFLQENTIQLESWGCLAP